MIRHSTRHIHATILKRVEDQLEALGWMDPSRTPFGADPVTEVRGTMPNEWEQVAKLKPGTVAVTLGQEFDAEPAEIGGPLATQEIPFFIDAIMRRESEAQSVLLDVRDLLKGRFAGLPAVVPVLDFTSQTPTPVDGWMVSFEDIEVEMSTMLDNWWILRCTALVQFTDAPYSPVVNPSLASAEAAAASGSALNAAGVV